MTRVKRFTANGEDIWVVTDEEAKKFESLINEARKDPIAAQVIDAITRHLAL
jgi:hypothetical protein